MGTAPTERMRYRGLRSLLAALLAGFVLFFQSETVFWGRPDRADWGELVATWLAYSVLAGLVLYALSRYRPRGWAGLVLVGAGFGWLAEGVLAATLYNLPLGLSWTGLAWHALLGVGACWYGLAAAVRRGWVAGLLAGAGLGAFSGWWAVMWWQPDEGGHVTPLADFAAWAFVNGAGLAASLAILPRLRPADGFRGRWPPRLLLGLLGVWFAVAVVPAVPFAPLVLLPLLGVTAVGLRRSRHRPGADLLADLSEPAPVWRYLVVLAVPAAAVTVYAGFLRSGEPVATNIPTAVVLTPAGFVAYGLALRRAWRAGPTG